MTTLGRIAGAGALVVMMGAGAPAGADTTAMTWATRDGTPPHVIAHRGASGERPEHTLEAYELAIAQGADWIEPDLVMSKDGVLVCRHDRFLSTTTDVAERPEFADRKTVKLSNGEEREDWWAEDFTLSELKTLRARQPYEGRPTSYDGLYEIPTFDEVIALVAAHTEETGETVGILPETKQPSALAALDLDVEAALLATFETAGWRDAAAPVIVQSFEPDILVALNDKTDVRLVQLVFDPGTGESNIPLDTLSAYADGVGPYKGLIVKDDGSVTDFITRAHALGLMVYPWTFRDDALPPDGATAAEEVERMMALGADGLFTDFPATALAVRERMMQAAQ